MPNQIRSFVFGALLVGLMPAVATRVMHAQTLDTVIGQGVAAVARLTSQTEQPAPRFDLTLDAAAQRALERNLDIAVRRIHPLVQDMQVVAANAAFLPFASSGLIVDQATTPNRFVFDGGGLAGQSIVTDLGVYDVAIGQQMKWGGGRYDIAWDSTRWESTNIFSTFNPSFGANMTLQYTQPLLRGFRTDARRTQLVVSRINRDISDIDLEETVVNTLAGVRLAYWDLVYARAAVGVQRQALALAEQLVADNRVPSRGRYHGAYRRRAGAVGSRGAPPVAGAGRRDAAHLRAGPQGAHRRGHVRCAVERGAEPDGPAARPGPRPPWRRGRLKSGNDGETATCEHEQDQRGKLYGERRPAAAPCAPRTSDISAHKIDQLQGDSGGHCDAPRYGQFHIQFRQGVSPFDSNMTDSGKGGARYEDARRRTRQDECAVRPFGVRTS